MIGRVCEHTSSTLSTCKLQARFLEASHDHEMAVSSEEVHVVVERSDFLQIFLGTTTRNLSKHRREERQHIQH